MSRLFDTRHFINLDVHLDVFRGRAFGVLGLAGDRARSLVLVLSLDAATPRADKRAIRKSVQLEDSSTRHTPS